MWNGLTARKVETMTTEVDLQAILPALQSQAARLNEASDNANRLLGGIEKQLIELNIGLEVWHSRPIDSSDSKGDLGPHQTSSRVVQLLGLARVDGKWCLAVKALRLVSGYFQGDMDCPYENQYLEAPPAPLLKASRALRLAALRAMPGFLAELNEHIGTTVRELEDAAGKLQ
jgi:hypothetical protein